MAIKISELTELTIIDLSADEVPIVDASAGRTKRIKPSLFYNTGIPKTFLFEGTDYHICKAPATYTTMIQRGTGTITLGKSTDGTSFSTVTLPFSVAEGDVISFECTGLTTYKSVLLK